MKRPLVQSPTSAYFSLFRVIFFFFLFNCCICFSLLYICFPQPWKFSYCQMMCFDKKSLIQDLVLVPFAVLVVSVPNDTSTWPDRSQTTFSKLLNCIDSKSIPQLPSHLTKAVYEVHSCWIYVQRSKDLIYLVTYKTMLSSLYSILWI